MKRFSIRFLLLLTLIAAILLALPTRRAMMQKRGRAWVERECGHITFAHKYNNATGEYDHTAELMTPRFLVDWLGIDFFDSVRHVTLDCYEVDDISPITDLQDLHSFAIMIEITDTLDFSPLAELPHLEEVYLDYTDISKERLDALRELLPRARVEAANHPPLDP
ncbi:MAG: hypothetical protein AAGG48_21935 [Planctomycetota bacterium]